VLIKGCFSVKIVFLVISDLISVVAVHATNTSPPTPKLAAEVSGDVFWRMVTNDD
jgi:hypothetical protein